ncbi:MAG TPA: hypothetical protein VKB46_00135 [Pyrinomonadaceae bacterium]|nr:hypothetical protein [Pyrinomonadaceae bacterium]
MKQCPTCHRAYQDDTLSFCLEDGTRLAVLSQPPATVLAPPPTAILPSERTPSNQVSGSTITAVTPPAFSQAAQIYAPTQKRGGAIWLVVGGLALIVIGLLVLVGYLATRPSNKAEVQPSQTSVPLATPSTTTNEPAKAKQEAEAKPRENVISWLNGEWKGEGFQTDTRTTWNVSLSVHDGVYQVSYPNIPCGGKWKLNSGSSRTATFTELITTNAGRCGNNSQVLIDKVSDSEISCKYSHAGSRLVVATAVLTKKAP